MSKILKDTDIIKNIAKEVITEMREQEKEKRKKKVFQNTKVLMKNYNKFKDHINNVSDSIEYDLDIEGDAEIKDNEILILSVTRTKLRTAKMIAYIDSALEIIRKNMIVNGEEYKFSAFYMYYIEEKTNEEIMEKHSCGKNTPKKWCDLVLNELSILLWGIEALGI